MSDLKQTPLYDLHRQLGAKMTAFAGYAMPVQYAKGIIYEHLHCRSRAGFFDISHMGQCRILGENAAAALEKLTPGGILDLAMGRQKYTLLTNPQGGVIDDIIVSRIETGLSLIVNAGCKEKDFAYLKQHLPADCVFEECAELALLALQGPEAAHVLRAAHTTTAADLAFMQVCSTKIAGIECSVSRSGYTGEDGFEISVHQKDAEQLARLLLSFPEVEPIGLGARDTLRLEAGLCLYGHELHDCITPIEAGLGWVFKKGHTDFPGADIILPQKVQGAKQRRVGLLVTGKIPVREGSIIYDSEQNPVGHVTSGSFSPTLKQPIAMALIQSESADVGTELFTSVRDQAISVKVCGLPFVLHRYQR